jgi:hypothetical protein
MSTLWITEYRGQAVEPGMNSAVPFGREAVLHEFGEMTRIVRLVADEPCLINFGGADGNPTYLPADRPEIFQVVRGGMITVLGEF